MLATRRLLQGLLLLGGILVLTACGGGGGGGGDGSGGDGDSASSGGGVSVAVPRRAFTVTSHHDSLVAPAALPVEFALSGMPRDGVQIAVESDSEFLLDAEYEDTGPTTGRVLLQLASGNTIGAGQRSATARLSFCRDAACTKHLAGSPVTVSVQYDVRSEDRKVRIEVVDPAPVFGVLTDATGPTAYATVRVHNPPAEGMRFDYGGGEVAAVSTTPLPDGHQLALTMRRPSTAGLGRHTSDNFLSVCFAHDCGRLRDVGYPRLHVEYTVTHAPVQQPRTFDLSVGDLAWDPVHRWLIVLIDGGAAGTYSNRGVMDPVSGALYLDPGGGPVLYNLALSPDGQWFVADSGPGRALYRFRRQDLVQNDRIVIKGDPNDASPSADSVAVLDLQYGIDGTLALLTLDDFHGTAPRGLDLRLLDGMTTRPVPFKPEGTLPGLGKICSFTWRAGDTSSILVKAAEPGFIPLTVSAEGLAAGSAFGSAPCTRGLQESSGWVFGRDGSVRKASDGSIAARLGVEPGSTGEVQDVAIDESRRRVYVLHTLNVDEVGDVRITAYDLDTLARIGAKLLRDAGEPQRLVRWGERGLALPNRRGKVLLLEGGIVDGT